MRLKTPGEGSGSPLELSGGVGGLPRRVELLSYEAGNAGNLLGCQMTRVIVAKVACGPRLPILAAVKVGQRTGEHCPHILLCRVIASHPSHLISCPSAHEGRKQTFPFLFCSAPCTIATFWSVAHAALPAPSWNLVKQETAKVHPALQL